MAGMSSPMRLKHDPNKSLKQVIKKHNLESEERAIEQWLDFEPTSPGALKKYFITTFNASGVKDKEGYDMGIDPNQVDLKDPMTWGEANPDMPMPPDQFFLELYKAIKTDEKRNAKRSSYEF